MEKLINDLQDCRLEIIELKAELSRIKYHTKNALGYYKANKPKEMIGAFEQALKGE